MVITRWATVACIERPHYPCSFTARPPHFFTKENAYATEPPSTGKIAPVMKLAAGLARKTTAAAISWGWP